MNGTKKSRLTVGNAASCVEAEKCYVSFVRIELNYLIDLNVICVNFFQPPRV